MVLSVCDVCVQTSLFLRTGVFWGLTLFQRDSILTNHICADPISRRHIRRYEGDALQCMNLEGTQATYEGGKSVKVSERLEREAKTQQNTSVHENEQAGYGKWEVPRA